LDGIYEMIFGEGHGSELQKNKGFVLRETFTVDVGRRFTMGGGVCLEV